jgi:hypothetical protein
MAFDDPSEFDRAIDLLFDAPDSPLTDFRMHCPTCSGDRRVHVSLLFPVARKRHTNSAELLPLTDPERKRATRVLLAVHCRDCHGDFTALRCGGPDGPAHIVIPTQHGGISTPNTHKAVRFYLDQAARAHSVGAFSAALSMYRAALEQLFWHHGKYRLKGTLGLKLAALEADRKGVPGKGAIGAKSPKWLREADPAVLRALKELGDGAIHPNRGQIERQNAIDANIAIHARIAFAELLQSMEAMRGSAERVSMLKTAARKVSPKKM